MGKPICEDLRVTLLGKFVRMKVNAELKKIEKILWCKEDSDGTVITRDCEGECLPQNHKSYRLF